MTLFKKRILAGAVILVLGYLALSRLYVTPILMYHHIDERAQEWKMSVSPESFARQMEFLKTHGYRVLSFVEYARLLKAGKKIPKKSIVITFDDGYQDNFTNAYPVLHKMQFPATIFMQIDGIGRAGYLTSEDLAIMSENHIDIGSHTLHHAFLPSVISEVAREEIFESKDKLEEILGKPVLVFAYPGGGHTPESVELVQEAQYEAAAATHDPLGGPLNPYALRRIRISRTADNLFVFWLQVSGFYHIIEDIRG